MKPLKSTYDRCTESELDINPERMITQSITVKLTFLLILLCVYPALLNQYMGFMYESYLIIFYLMLATDTYVALRQFSDDALKTHALVNSLLCVIAIIVCITYITHLFL